MVASQQKAQINSVAFLGGVRVFTEYVWVFYRFHPQTKTCRLIGFSELFLVGNCCLSWSLCVPVMTKQPAQTSCLFHNDWW